MGDDADDVDDVDEEEGREGKNPKRSRLVASESGRYAISIRSNARTQTQTQTQEEREKDEEISWWWKPYGREKESSFSEVSVVLVYLVIMFVWTLHCIHMLCQNPMIHFVRWRNRMAYP